MSLLVPKFYGPLANWLWVRISPQSSLNVIYCLIITAWQWCMRTFLDVMLPESNTSLSRQGSESSLTQRVAMPSLFSTRLLQSVWICSSHPQDRGQRWPESASHNGDGCMTMWMYWMPLDCTLKIVKMLNFMLCICYHNKNNKISWWKFECKSQFLAKDSL